MISETYQGARQDTAQLKSLTASRNRNRKLSGRTGQRNADFRAEPARQAMDQLQAQACCLARRRTRHPRAIVQDPHNQPIGGLRERYRDQGWAQATTTAGVRQFFFSVMEGIT